MLKLIAIIRAELVHVFGHDREDISILNIIGAFNHLLQPISVWFIKVDDDGGYLLYKLVGP